MERGGHYSYGLLLSFYSTSQQKQNDYISAAHTTTRFATGSSVVSLPFPPPNQQHSSLASIHSCQLTATSRQIFAFARDGGFPFSSWLYNVNHRVHAPVRCVWFAATIALFLGLLSFAGPNAIGAVFSLFVIAQNMAYSIPITARHLGGGGENKIARGPFHLGRFVRI